MVRSSSKVCLRGEKVGAGCKVCDGWAGVELDDDDDGFGEELDDDDGNSRGDEAGGSGKV